MKTLDKGKSPNQVKGTAFHEYEILIYAIARYHEAETSIHDRNARKQEVVESCLESDLELLGLTGVEDKLQDGVRNTLELMRNAGLKIWMLTGKVYINDFKYLDHH